MKKVSMRQALDDIKKLAKDMGDMQASYTVEVSPLISISFEVSREVDMTGVNAFVERMKAAHLLAMESVRSGVENHLELQMKSSWGGKDIVDSGKLMESGSVFLNGDDVIIEYSSPYANLVHYGGYVAPYGNTSIEKVYVPGRPWISATLGLSPGPAGAYDYETQYLKTFSSSMRGA